MFEAGTKYLSAFSSYSVWPVSPSVTNNPHSPLSTGVAANSASTRSPNLRVAAETCGFLVLETVFGSDFDPPSSASAKSVPADISHASTIVSAIQTRHVPPAGKLASGKVQSKQQQ